jgi:hypothetical protein
MGIGKRLERRLARLSGNRELTSRELFAARALANEVYFEELERVL